jgi:minor curlin subunit
MIRRALIASVIATLGLAALASTSEEGRAQEYPSPTHIDQIPDNHVSIEQQGTGNSASVEQGGTTPVYTFVSAVRTLLGAGDGSGNGANEQSQYSASIIQNGSEQQATVRQYGSGHQNSIAQTGTSNSAEVGQWGTAAKADVQQNGANLAVRIDQFGDNRSVGVHQFGQGAGLPVTVRQY